MNSTIQQPTTLIKIRKYSVEEETEEEIKLGKGIDFYNFEFNNKKSNSQFTHGYSQANSFAFLEDDDDVKNRLMNIIKYGKDVTPEPEVMENVPFEDNKLGHTKDLFLQMPIQVSSVNEKNDDRNVCTANPFDLSNTKKFKRSKRKYLDIGFVINNLKFDLRVKEFEITNDFVLVYFFCKADSLSFYKQYFSYFDLSFSSYCDWLSPSLSVAGYFDVETEINIIKEHIEAPKIKPIVKEVSEDNKFSRKRFLDRIEYFNQLKSCFTKADLKLMMMNLEKGETDFVFSNTKELAVGSKSNKIMQDAIKIMSGEELDRVYDNLEYDIVPISATKHGAYTIQTLLNYSTNKSHRGYISQYFSKEGEFLLAHEIGNYTFQKIIAFNNDLVCNFFISNFEDVVNTELGMKVFKRCIEHLEDRKEDIFTKIAEYKETDYNLYSQLKQITKNM